MKQLTSENKVIWILGKIGQFILLNFLVLLGCIPVVTIGASVTAGMYCMSKNALLLAFGRLPRTLLLWMIWGFPVAIVIFYPIWMVAFGWFFITIGVAVLLWMSWLVQRGAVA